jgi:hypothetical protein
MPMSPNAEREGAPSRAPLDDTWKDEFVDALLRELRRQLHQLQNAQPTPDADQAGIRAQNVQTLARIERSLDRLMKLQEQRVLKRDIKDAAAHVDSRAALERRLDQLLESARALAPAERPDAG